MNIATTLQQLFIKIRNDIVGKI